MGGSRVETEPSWFSTPFGRSFPLFVLAGAFFVSGVLVWVAWPRYGPGAFTLWALLLALGFIASIGGVASWLLPGDDPEPDDARSIPAVVRASFQQDPAGLRPGAYDAATRAEFGRPLPDVSRRSTRALRPAVAAPPAEHTPARLPVWSEEGAMAAELEPVANVLADLDGIEQELAPRRSGAPQPSA
jgi:hypothetical protein